MHLLNFIQIDTSTKIYSTRIENLSKFLSKFDEMKKIHANRRFVEISLKTDALTKFHSKKLNFIRNRSFKKIPFKLYASTKFDSNPKFVKISIKIRCIDGISRYLTILCFMILCRNLTQKVYVSTKFH